MKRLLFALALLPILAFGQGIRRPAPRYETGTFTPTLLSNGAAVGRTYSVQMGRYTRIGRRVFFDLFVALAAKGSSTGNTTIAGLPYVATAAPNSVAVLSLSNLTWAAGRQPVAIIGGASAALSLFTMISAGPTVAVVDSDLANNFNVQVSGSYDAAE